MRQDAVGYLHIAVGSLEVFAPNSGLEPAMPQGRAAMIAEYKKLLWPVAGRYFETR